MRVCVQSCDVCPVSRHVAGWLCLAVVSGGGEWSGVRAASGVVSRVSLPWSESVGPPRLAGR